MVKVILKMVVVLALLCYGALFLLWNNTVQEIVTWQMLGVKYSQALPVGALAFAGLIVGAILMAVACWSAWATQRAVAVRATAQVKKAKEKLQAQLDVINELRARNAQLDGELASLQSGDGTWGQASAADVTLPEAPAEAPPPTPAAGDDPEVI